MRSAGGAPAERLNPGGADQRERESVGIELSSIADRLIAVQDGAAMLAPFTAALPDFSVADAYAVMAEIEARRRAQGWRPVGRKIGFTNTTIWPRYGVWQPNFAHVWDRTVHRARENRATLALAPFVLPRIEPEVVFGLGAPVPLTDDPLAVLACVEWIAPGFEIVQSHFPDWKFKAPDCTADCALHGALVVGAPVAVTARNRAALAETLPVFAVTLSRGDALVDRGIGANVLKSPALALAHLARVLAGLPKFPPLAAGEIVTTGTITDAWPVAPGETWSSDYGALGLAGLTLTFT
jgi:2-oxo-3-hexenedioate decarboxylase